MGVSNLVRREIDRACELSCDEVVIKLLNNNGKQGYSDTQIAMEADIKTPKTIVPTTMCEEKKALKERLSAIMKSKKLTRRIMVFSCVLLLAALCVTVVLGASSVKESAADILFREYQDDAAVVRPVSVIKQINFDNKDCLIFYYTILV